MRFSLILSLLSLLLCAPASSDQVFQLFSADGEAAEDYKEIIAQLKSPDRKSSTLRLPTRSGTLADFNVGVALGVEKEMRYPGESGTDLILTLDEDWILRVPCGAGDLSVRKQRFPPELSSLVTFLTSIEQIVSGYEFYAPLGVDLVEVDLKRSFAPYYAVMRRVSERFSLKEYLEQRNELPAAERDLIDRDLIRFGATTFRLRNIQDFRPINILFTGHKWQLIDWGLPVDTEASHLLFNPRFTPEDSMPNKNTFQKIHFSELPAALFEAISATISKSRANLLLHGCEAEI